MKAGSKGMREVLRRQARGGARKTSLRQTQRARAMASVVNAPIGQAALDQVPQHKLEAVMGDTLAAVHTRKERLYPEAHNLPVEGSDFDTAQFYEQVYGTNCENVVGFMPIPVGVIGPLRVNGEDFTVPLATTEGALIASANRGARAIREAGGASCAVLRDGMTRSPCVKFPTATEAVQFAQWLEDPAQFEQLSEYFSSTTNFGKLTSVKPTVAGRNVYLRFEASTGDAMGMNMVGKGVNRIIEEILKSLPNARLVALSSNMCTDKKPSAANWVHGRGKSVVCDVVLSKEIVETVLKTTIPELASLNVAKNLIGSSLAGSIGGNNAHSSNLVTAVFLATGQDPAQNVVSSNCLVMMEPQNDNQELYVSVTMPSIECGTVGGGTALPAQRECLNQLGIAGANQANPGENSRKLAQIIAATVLAGELSLNAALSSNHLISAHMALNRK